ncbi:MAG: DegT/DnrJ/EryC1/StrS aminotransferase family protein [Candidatus Aminicenantales bacterium]|jgi:dTDP-4-amino-4,6-dideoxygalactose transaminase
MHWKVPLSDIDFDGAEKDAVLKVLESKWLMTGEVTARFEGEFSRFTGSRHAIALSSCTAALHIACYVLGIRPGDEVIVPALTFVATANAVLYCGGTPVFADIVDEKTLSISPDDVARKITPRTKAIIVVHYGGYFCDMSAFQQICFEKGIDLIEDAAHSPGAYMGDKHAGTFAKAGCFSFVPNKNMTTAEGGMLITDDDDLANKARATRSHGLTTMTWDRYRGHAYSYDVPVLGFNYRIDEIRSAIGLVQLGKLKGNNKRREHIVSRYVEALEKINGIEIPFKERIKYPNGETPSFHLFPILVQNERTRDALMEFLKGRGIQTSIHYPPVHLFTYYRSKFGTREGMLPKTEDISRRLLTLPLYGTLSEEQVEYIVESLRTFSEKE